MAVLFYIVNFGGNGVNGLYAFYLFCQIILHVPDRFNLNQNILNYSNNAVHFFFHLGLDTMAMNKWIKSVSKPAIYSTAIFQ
jgi:hypothetical protein